MIFIRTDANEEIATGHIMRCMTLAQEFIKKKHEVIFLISCEESVEFLENNNFKYILLKNCEPFGNEEIEQIKSMLFKYQIKCLLVDSYAATATYLNSLNKLTPVAYFDIFCKEKYDISFLINYDGYCKIDSYKTKYADTNVKYLIGPEYASLREQFRNRNKKTPDKIKNILLLSGGMDRYNAIGRQIEFFKDKPEFLNYEYFLVAGLLNENIEFLKRLADKYNNVHLLRNVVNMADLMEKNDIAVSAASTTLYELCAIGTPTIFYEASDDQLEDKLFFANKDIMLYTGDFRFNFAKTIEEIWKNIKLLSENRELWEKYSKKMKTVTDGKGAERIVDAILDLCNAKEKIHEDDGS